MLARIHVGAPIVRGPLTLFPLWTEHPETPAPYTCGSAAEGAGLLTIGEQASAAVPELTVENEGTQPVLLVEGEVIAGGLQHRTLNLTVLVPALATLALPVSCIEAGRWGNIEHSRRAGFHVPPSIRFAKTASVNDARRRGLGRVADQGGVWNDVAAFHTRAGQHTDTGSYLSAAEGVATSIDGLVEGLAPLPGQRGVIVGIGGRVRALELFDRAATFAELFPGMLRGYAADALGSDPVATSSSAARQMVRRAARAKVARSAGVGLGEELSADEAGFTLAGLALDDEPVHLVALAGA